MDIVYIAVLIFLQIAFLIQLYFIFVFHQKLVPYQLSNDDRQEQLPVSIIVCARNELENLKKNLPLLLAQEHPNFELVVVNDCSNDGSAWFLKDLAEAHDRIKVVTIEDHPRFKHGKKFAVTLGIKAAQNEQMIFTDADCCPASPKWLSLMQQGLTKDKKVVLGFSPYTRLPGFLNKFIRFETLFTAINYLSFALAGKPYMGVGRNLGYVKDLFFRGKGFASHMHIQSGDDDLFVNQNSTPNNTSVILTREAFVYSVPKTSISGFISQKLRHQGAGQAYRKEHKRILTCQALSGVLYYALLMTLVLLGGQWWLIASIYIIRLFIQGFMYFPIYKKMGSMDLFWWMPLLDFIYYFYLTALTLLGGFKKNVAWK